MHFARSRRHHSSCGRGTAPAAARPTNHVDANSETAQCTLPTPIEGIFRKAVPRVCEPKWPCVESLDLKKRIPREIGQRTSSFPSRRIYVGQAHSLFVRNYFTICHDIEIVQIHPNPC